MIENIKFHHGFFSNWTSVTSVYSGFIIGVFVLLGYFIPLTSVPNPAEVQQLSSSVPLQMNESVAAEIRSWQTLFGKISFSLLKDRYELYQAKFKNLYVSNHVPIELLAIPAVETYFLNRDPVKHSGMWNLSSFTAQFYDLRVDEEKDDRTNLELEAKTALTYLNDFHRTLSSWLLSILAYRKDAGWVKSQMLIIHSEDPWLIEKSGNLSEPYLSRAMAVIILMKSP